MIHKDTLSCFCPTYLGLLVKDKIHGILNWLFFFFKSVFKLIDWKKDRSKEDIHMSLGKIFHFQERDYKNTKWASEWVTLMKVLWNNKTLKHIIDEAFVMWLSLLCLLLLNDLWHHLHRHRIVINGCTRTSRNLLFDLLSVHIFYHRFPQPNTGIYKPIGHLKQLQKARFSPNCLNSIMKKSSLSKLKMDVSELPGSCSGQFELPAIVFQNHWGNCEIGWWVWKPW